MKFRYELITYVLAVSHLTFVEVIQKVVMATVEKSVHGKATQTVFIDYGQEIHITCATSITAN